MRAGETETALMDLGREPWNVNGRFRFVGSVAATVYRSSSNSGAEYERNRHGRKLNGRTYDEMPDVSSAQESSSGVSS